MWNKKIVKSQHEGYWQPISVQIESLYDSKEPFCFGVENLAE
jgi:hypothetical protein